MATVRNDGGALPQEAGYHTVEEYLAFERAAETKHEYEAGAVIALAGASRAHNLITGNVARQLGNRLAGRPCETYASDMRVRSTPSSYVYPDVVVACGEPAFADEALDVLLNPTLVVEVLSRSTERRDRLEKLAGYRSAPTLREYLLVAQNRVHVEHYVRQPTDDWLLQDVDDPSATLRLASLGVELRVAEIYERVTFPAEPPLRRVREAGVE